MKTQDPSDIYHLFLVYSKRCVLHEHNFTDDQISKVQEFEFTLNNNKGTVECLETWSNGNRTKKSHKVYTIKPELQKHLGDLAKKVFSTHLEEA